MVWLIIASVVLVIFISGFRIAQQYQRAVV